MWGTEKVFNYIIYEKINTVTYKTLLNKKMLLKRSIFNMNVFNLLFKQVNDLFCQFDTNPVLSFVCSSSYMWT